MQQIWKKRDGCADHGKELKNGNDKRKAVLVLYSAKWEQPFLHRILKSIFLVEC